jgi:ABC-2 type transport system permease protein
MINYCFSEFSVTRFLAIIIKEFIQMRRDRLTFAMIILMPLIQLTIFGYAINTNPKNLPTAVITADNSMFSRSIVQTLKNSNYFRIMPNIANEQTAIELLKKGKAQFIISIPVDFSKKLLRKEHPTILIEADASDPSATSNALGAIFYLNQIALNHDFKGPLAFLKTPPAAFDINIHKNYNPEEITQYNVVPGLIGVILTMTMIMMTSIAVTRERERGTLENLLATPAKPLEVMFGKIIPYIIVGYIQVGIILIFAKFLFKIPMEGNMLLLLCCIFIFVITNLSVGITFSTIAKNQMQAIQMTFFFFLPSVLLSGFMFPFYGMPGWAQIIGEILPLTHFLRIIRGILLKSNGLAEVISEIICLLFFMLTIIFLGFKRYNKTLD